MKSFRLSSLFLAVAVGACAPAAPATQPSPAEAPDAPASPEAPATPEGPESPATEAPSTPATPEAPAPAPASGAPERWWLADADATVPGAGVERAYRDLLAGRAPSRTVIVGVIDSGVEIGHEDLDDNVWVNEDEVAGNGVDDDGNGYVDDVHGWNFIGGPDGRHVDEDTYEATRLYARCQAGEEVADPGRSAGIGSCEEVEADFMEARRKTEQQLAQLRNMADGVQRVVEVLRRETAGDSLTPARVRALTPMRVDARQARAVYLQLADAGITPAMIVEERDRLEAHLARGLDPDFDPRHIVGDDYDDATERIYGNPDVVGPGADHGTGVAGIIAAERDNGIGGDGVAPSARIMVLRTVPDGDERDKDVANAIRYAVDNGADIINMSFGKGHSPRKDVVDAAVRYAEERGVLIVHAAGNDGADLATAPSYPVAAYLDGGAAGNWIEVGATGWDVAQGLAAAFSNYGDDEVDVFAPGVDIHTTDVDNSFQTISGTSFAAPVVSGLAALIMAYYPELSAADVRQVILDSATPHAALRDLSITGGIVNAHAALELARQRAAAD